MLGHPDIDALMIGGWTVSIYLTTLKSEFIYISFLSPSLPLYLSFHHSLSFIVNAESFDAFETSIIFIYSPSSGEIGLAPQGVGLPRNQYLLCEN